MSTTSTAPQFILNDFIFAYKRGFSSDTNLLYLLILSAFLLVLLIGFAISFEINIIFCIDVYLFIYSAYVCFYIIFLVGFISSTISNYRLSNMLKKPNKANEWKNTFLSTSFTNVYYLLIARAFNLLSDTEYAVKKHEFVNKMYITNDSFMVLAKYYGFLSINDIDFTKQKQNFLANNEKISNKNLTLLITNNIITQEDSKFKKVNLDDKVFVAKYISTALYLILGANYLFHIF